MVTGRSMPAKLFCCSLGEPNIAEYVVLVNVLSVQASDAGCSSTVESVMLPWVNVPSARVVEVPRSTSSRRRAPRSAVTVALGATVSWPWWLVVFPPLPHWVSPPASVAVSHHEVSSGGVPPVPVMARVPPALMVQAESLTMTPGPRSAVPPACTSPPLTTWVMPEPVPSGVQ